jgi:hypothetical protein
MHGRGGWSASGRPGRRMGGAPPRWNDARDVAGCNSRCQAAGGAGVRAFVVARLPLNCVGPQGGSVNPSPARRPVEREILIERRCAPLR